MATRQTHYAEDNTQQDIAAALTSTLTNTFTPDASSDYLFIWSASLKHSVTTSDALCDFYDGTTSLSSFNIEPSDATAWFSVGGIAKVTFGGSPGSQSYSIRCGREGGTASIRDERIVALKMDAADKYAESLSNNSTPGDAVSLTFTPATSGDYLIIGSADISNNGGSGQYTINLDVNGTNYHAHSPFQTKDTTNWRSWVGMKVVTLAASSQTVKVEFGANFNTTTVRNARIAAIRLDGFEASTSGEQLTRQTNNTTSYTAPLTVNFTPANVKHLIIAASVMDCSSTSVDAFNKLTEGGSTITEVNEEPVNTVNKWGFFTIYEKTLAASNTDWKIEHKNESAGNTTGTDDAMIAIIQVEAVGGGAAFTPRIMFF